MGEEGVNIPDDSIRKAGKVSVCIQIGFLVIIIVGGVTAFLIMIGKIQFGG